MLLIADSQLKHSEDDIEKLVKRWLSQLEVDFPGYVWRYEKVADVSQNICFVAHSEGLSS